MRRRSCDNPSPKHGGIKCVGDPVQERQCNSHPCTGKNYQLLSYSESTDKFVLLITISLNSVLFFLALMFISRSSEVDLLFSSSSFVNLM